MIPDLETYIYTTLQAQSGLTALVSTRITNIFGSRQTLTFPYIVYQITDDQEQDTMRGDGVRAKIEFHIFDIAEGNTNDTCRQIMDQLRGNGATQSSKLPTYGLHRKVPGLQGSGWYIAQIFRTGGSTAHERDVLHYIEAYETTGSIGT
jgi:hypothetical protein